VHAICEDVVIAEIQQNSDVTYRVYDYNRVSPNGMKRPLHIEKAVEVSKLIKENFDGKAVGETVELNDYKKKLLSKCQYFTVYEYTQDSKCELATDEKSFNAILFIEGSGVVRNEETEVEFNKGDTIFIPANMGKYIIEGKSKYLVTSV